MIEKYIGYDARGYYMNWHDIWEEIPCPFGVTEKEYYLELAKKNKGTKFRVRPIWTGKIELEIQL